MTNTAAWIWHVSGSSWNDVNMEVRDSLPSRRALIEADVESVRRVSFAQKLLRAADGIGESDTLLFGEIQPLRNVTFRDE